MLPVSVFDDIDADVNCMNTTQMGAMLCMQVDPGERGTGVTHIDVYMTPT